MFPELLKIEITSRCNAKCIFCRHDNYKGMDMDFDIFKLIVDSFPETKVVHPQFFGEPTLYPQFVEALKYLKDNKKQVCFYTNGSFPLGNIKDILNTHPDKIIFSIEADNEKLYNKIRPGLNWKVLLANIELCNKSVNVIVRMTVCKENKKQIQRIKKYWQDKGLKVVAVPEVPIRRGRAGKYNDYICKRPLKQFVVKANGDVVLCCTDWFGKYVIGNVKDGCVNVWNSKKFKELRDRINTETAPSICDRCGFRMR